MDGKPDTTIEAIHRSAFNAGVCFGMMIGAGIMAVAWAAFS